MRTTSSRRGAYVPAQKLRATSMASFRHNRVSRRPSRIYRRPTEWSRTRDAGAAKTYRLIGHPPISTLRWGALRLSNCSSGGLRTLACNMLPRTMTCTTRARQQPPVDWSRDGSSQDGELRTHTPRRLTWYGERGMSHAILAGPGPGGYGRSGRSPCARRWRGATASTYAVRGSLVSPLS